MELTYESIELGVKRCAARQLNISDSDITTEHSLEKYGADSLDRVEIVMYLEEEFSIDIPDHEEGKLKNQPISIYCSLVYVKLSARTQTLVPPQHLENLSKCQIGL